ncbi:hypothetical protein [Pseudomonas syringae]|uniref:hypothetical protein n=1 Tax=Pseudomonas syringae TaxID=317 RepID=UPI0006244026|nr:hypothetical protein [Pseudomonas syringae]AKF51660.1 hypothetical protein PsyrH_14425 [Pseudomonas syringae pv. syringae HS191]RML67721.1 hypothetical protein ALQ91_200187 [Pseudomonas syringae pv. syringae]RMO47176.1 hypothetical protein ALQ40_02242 [Pseudomonas syringae]SFO19221.1 hypothetical protein SAMN05444063_10285 [Pseudomonas syringae]
MIKVMLSLDLTNAKESRPELYSVLEEAGWKKASNVDTVWLKDYKYANLDDQTVTTIRNDISKPLIDAHKKLKLDKIYYVAQIGNTTAISRLIEKRAGEVSIYAQELFN